MSDCWDVTLRGPTGRYVLEKMTAIIHRVEKNIEPTCGEIRQCNLKCL
jgi:hypothetical protein